MAVFYEGQRKESECNVDDTIIISGGVDRRAVNVDRPLTDAGVRMWGRASQGRAWP